MRPVVVLLVLGLVAGVAAAQSTRGRALFEAGRAAYRDGRFGDASARFVDAYDVDHLPGLLFDAALAARRQYVAQPGAATLEAAIGLYQRYLREWPDSPHRKEAEETLATLAAARPRDGGRVDGGVATPDGGVAPAAPRPAAPPDPTPATPAPDGVAAPAGAPTGSGIVMPPPMTAPPGSAMSPPHGATPMTSGAPPLPPPIIVQSPLVSPPPVAAPPPKKGPRPWVIIVATVSAVTGVALAVGIGVAVGSSGRSDASLGSVSFPLAGGR